MDSHPGAHRQWGLSEAQSGLYYAWRLDPLNSLFNTGQYVEIGGALDLAAFTRAADRAASEAEALSLSIEEGGEAPLQWLDPQQTPRLDVVDLSQRPDGRDIALGEIAREMALSSDPRRRPLARQVLYRLSPEQHIFFQRIHHLAIDGYGTVLLAQRLEALYAAEISGADAGASLGTLAAVLDEDIAYRTSEKKAKDRAFWQDYLAGLPDEVGLTPGKATSAGTFIRTSRIWSGFAKIEALVKGLDTPWPDVLTALTSVYLHRFASGPELVVGVPQMNRFGSVSARVPAMVMNILPLRIRPEADASVAGFIAGLARDLVRGRRHGRYRSEQMRRDLGLIGGQRRLYGPLINVLPFEENFRLKGLDTTTTRLSTGPVDDLTISFRGDGRGGMIIEIDANPDLYGAAEIEAHADRLGEFLEKAASTPLLTDIPTAGVAEAQHLLFGVNDTAHPIPQTTLTALIERQMAKTPDAVALAFEGATLSYGELDRRTSALAAQLQARGVGRESLVGIALPRSLELLVGLVAILRAGAAYLPLDLDHPPARLGRILHTGKPALILARQADRPLLQGQDILAPEKWATMGEVVPTGQPHDAAYVIFTSGSTGEPKGVLVEHLAIVNRLEWMADHYGFGPGDVILQKTPVTFDVSVWELFLPLICGARLAIAPPGAHKDPRHLAALLREHAVTTAHFVPSMLSAFLNEPEARGLHIERVFCSGEELGADLRNRFHQTLSGQLHNLYGPTEAAVDVSYWPASAQDRTRPVPIGFPVWNTQLYVLDAAMRPTPPGVTGELYLGGIQLARGYLGRDDLTAERFLANPFLAGERIYRTGDLARRRPDGSVVYIGRADHQVKIRGLRIELGEIEAAALASAQIRDAVALARDEGRGDKKLVLYIVPAEGYAPIIFRQALATRLVDYMMPTAIVELPSLPVTSNGKLDRAALPAPRFEVPASRPAQTQGEQRLARLFAETLSLAEAPGADADFFALGGDSLSAVALMLAIRGELGHDPGLGALFEHPTIAGLARHIEAADQEFDAGLGPLIRLGAGPEEVPPLFVVHPAGGISWGYRGLARALAPERATYGLQAPALDPERPVPPDLDTLAADYAALVLALAGPGPIHLAGWSVGGLIAQAMAVHLEARGEKVGLVAMFDSYPSECWRAEPEPTESEALRSLLSIAGYDAEAYPHLQTRRQIVEFLVSGDSPLGRLPLPTLDGVIRVVMETNRLVRRHYHKRFAGTLTHIRAALDHQGRDLHPRQWQPYAAALDLVDVPFLHPQLTGRDATALIAPLLADRMDRLDKGESP